MQGFLYFLYEWLLLPLYDDPLRQAYIVIVGMGFWAMMAIKEEYTRQRQVTQAGMTISHLVCHKLVDNDTDAALAILDKAEANGEADKTLLRTLREMTHKLEKYRPHLTKDMMQVAQEDEEHRLESLDAARYLAGGALKITPTLTTHSKERNNPLHSQSLTNAMYAVVGLLIERFYMVIKGHQSLVLSFITETLHFTISTLFSRRNPSQSHYESKGALFLHRMEKCPAALEVDLLPKVPQLDKIDPYTMLLHVPYFPWVLALVGVFLTRFYQATLISNGSSLWLVMFVEVIYLVLQMTSRVVLAYRTAVLTYLGQDPSSRDPKAPAFDPHATRPECTFDTFVFLTTFILQFAIFASTCSIWAFVGTVLILMVLQIFANTMAILMIVYVDHLGIAEFAAHWKVITEVWWLNTLSALWLLWFFVLLCLTLWTHTA